MRQNSRNLIFGVAICVFVLISIALYSSIDAKDQSKKALFEQEKVCLKFPVYYSKSLRQLVTQGLRQFVTQSLRQLVVQFLLLF